MTSPDRDRRPNAPRKIHPNIPERVHADLAAYAERQGVSQSEAVSQLLEKALRDVLAAEAVIDPNYQLQFALREVIKTNCTLRRLWIYLLKKERHPDEDEQVHYRRIIEDLCRDVERDEKIATALSGEPIAAPQSLHAQMRAAGLPVRLLRLLGVDGADA